jgi:hypothetical protein
MVALPLFSIVSWFSNNVCIYISFGFEVSCGCIFLALQGVHRSCIKKRLWPILLLNLYLVLISFLLPLFKDQGMFCFRYIVSFPLQLYVYDALVLLNYLHVYGIIFVAFIICSLLCASMFALVDVFICFLCCYMGIFYHVLHLFCFIHR